MMNNVFANIAFIVCKLNRVKVVSEECVAGDCQVYKRVISNALFILIFFAAL